MTLEEIRREVESLCNAIRRETDIAKLTRLVEKLNEALKLRDRKIAEREPPPEN